MTIYSMIEIMQSPTGVQNFKAIMFQQVPKTQEGLFYWAVNNHLWFQLFHCTYIWDVIQTKHR